MGGWVELYPNCFWILGIFLTLQSPLGNCAQCDYGLFGGGLIVIVNHVFTLFYLPQC